MAKKIKALSQRDKRWRDALIGKSKLSLGRWGCLVACVSMASFYFSCYRDPKWLSKNLKFTSGGLLIWSSINEETCFSFAGRWRKFAAIKKEAEKAIMDPNYVVLLEVQGYHWVVAFDVIGKGEYRIADPWLGDIATTQRYRNDITGAAFVHRDLNFLKNK